jgi:hypothetical protein
MLNQPFLMLMLAVLLMTVLVSTAAPSLQQMKSPASGGMANGVLHLMAAAEGGAALGERLSALRETLNSTLERARDELDDRFERNGRELGVRRWRRKHARATAKANASSLPSTAGAFDARCHAREHTGYAGDGAVVWGLGKPGFHLPDAPTCCRACIAHNEVCSLPESRGKRWWPDRPDMRCGGDPSTACTIWTFCPIDRCFAFDIHKHEFGECWLKFQKGTDPPYTQPKGARRVSPRTQLASFLATLGQLSHRWIARSILARRPPLWPHKVS